MGVEMQGLARLLAVLATMCALLVGAAGAQATTSYVAIGDSYSAGSGASASDLSATCFRSSKGYPQVVAAQRPDLTLTNVTCGGAVTSDVTTKQVPSLSTSTGVVTITIGGNDVGFVNLIIACGTGSSTLCQSQIASTNSQIANQLPAKLDATYAAIEAAAPNATVVSMGYPRMFGSSGCLAAGPLTASSRTGLNGVADNLDAVIKARSLAHGFSYVSAIGPFTGHDVCSSSAWIWGLANPWGPYGFHPNATGHASGYAAMVRSVIG